MTEKDVEKILNESTQDEWIVNDTLGAFTYKDDLNLRIQRAEYDEYRDFNEEWATNHPDSNAKAIDYKVFYNNSFVKEKTLVSVDGYRASLPIPKSPSNLYVSSNDVNFAKIVDISGRTDEYLERSGLKIEK